MKKPLIPIIIGILITFLFTTFAVVRLIPFERLELLLYDIRYHLHGKEKPPKEVVIVGIDDRSLEKIGRWPWERKRVASIIDTLKNMGAKVIVMDIILSEPSKGDDILAKSIKRAGNVILPIVFDFKDEKKKVEDDMLFDSAFPMVRKMDYLKIFPPISAHSVLLPLKNLSKGAKTLGYINMFPDKDGVLRWEVTALEYNGEIYPSIDLQAVRLFLDLPMEAMILNATEGVQLGKKFIPTDFWGRTLIYYYGPERTFQYISVLDVIEKKIEPSRIKDKIVLIGATAVGIYDLRVTPTSPAMPGIEKHASVIASFLHGDFILKVANITNVLIVLISGILFSFLIVRLRAIYGAILAFAFISIIFFIGYFLFFVKGLWIDLSYSGNNLVIIYFVITAYRYATEERYAKKIRGMFSSYVTEKLVDELIKHPDLAKLGGERREITVLFSDVRGFTTFSEKHTPEEVVAMLNEYLGEMTRIIFLWDGTLDKFVGDEIVAFWGAPVPQEDHAELALKCTFHMVRRLKELEEKWVSEGKEPLRAGFGLNTGDMIVGNIGAEGKKMDYTVIGDNVNLGARVEGLTRKYNTDIIITEYTLNKTKDIIMKGTFGHVSVRGLDMVVVKGRAKPVNIYEIVSLTGGEKSVITECEAKEVIQFKEK
jgi:adenylate cyclase